MTSGLCVCLHSHSEHVVTAQGVVCLNWDDDAEDYCTCMAFTDRNVQAPPEPRTDLCEQCGHELTDHAWDGCTVQNLPAGVKASNAFECRCPRFAIGASA